MSSLRKSSRNSGEDDGEQLRRGPWNQEEDSLLIHYISRHGQGRWNLLAKRAGLRRTGKSCRLRWLNYLKPDVKRGNLTPQEQFLILELHSKWGNRWSKIVQNLPGRTDNEIKNYWRTRVQKQARYLKIDANSTAFQNVIRRFLMPKLLQRIEESSQNPTVPQFQYQALTTSMVQQVPGQSPRNLIEAVQSLHQQNSDSEHSASSCVYSSSECMNDTSKVSQFAENHSSSFDNIGENDYSNTLAKDCCYVDNVSSSNSSCYDMETIDQLASTSAIGDLVGDFHMPENSCVNDGFADGLWSMEELWELRNLH
ncbi:hypothetical protein PTKIN_Ptkin05aG0136700 [Pterospermum kingtungense]